MGGRQNQRPKRKRKAEQEMLRRALRRAKEALQSEPSVCHYCGLKTTNPAIVIRFRNWTQGTELRLCDACRQSSGLNDAIDQQVTTATTEFQRELQRLAERTRSQPRFIPTGNPVKLASAGLWPLVTTVKHEPTEPKPDDAKTELEKLSRPRRIRRVAWGEDGDKTS